jgi:hypothetical protein
MPAGGRKEKHVKPSRGERSSKNTFVKEVATRQVYGALPLEVVRRQLDDWKIGFDKEQKEDASCLPPSKEKVASEDLSIRGSGASQTCESAECRAQDAEQGPMVIGQPVGAQVSHHTHVTGVQSVCHIARLVLGVWPFS